MDMDMDMDMDYSVDRARLEVRGCSAWIQLWHHGLIELCKQSTSTSLASRQATRDYWSTSKPTTAVTMRMSYVSSAEIEQSALERREQRSRASL